MRYLAALLVAASLASGCALAGRKTPPKPKQVVCMWPDPLYFDLNTDSWQVCFQVEHNEFSSPFRCTTVRELRAFLDRQSANNNNR